MTTPLTKPLLDAAPTPPTRSDVANFRVRADAFLAWIAVTFWTALKDSLNWMEQTLDAIQAYSATVETKAGQASASANSAAQSASAAAIAADSFAARVDVNVTTITAANSPYALALGNAGLVILDASAGNVSATLPLANVLQARQFDFVRLDSTANTATVTPSGTNTVNQATAALPLAAKGAQSLASNGVDGWYGLSGSATASSAVIKTTVRLATTENIANLAGGAPRWVDGAGTEVGVRILVKDQASAAQNGIYVVTVSGTGANGTWVRAADADSASEVAPGMQVTVEYTDAHTPTNTVWELTTPAPITLGTTPLTFVEQGMPLTFYRTRRPLPTTNIGPIWHDAYNSIMTWQTFTANGANYTGYASINIGSLLLDTQPTARQGYVQSGVSNLSRTAYAALRGWALHNGVLVHSGAWFAGNFAFKDNADGATFTVADVRGEFPRFWDEGRGVNLNRAVLSAELGQNATHTHGGTTDSAGEHTHSDYYQYASSSTSVPSNYEDGSLVSVAAKLAGASTTTGSAGAHAHTFTTASEGGTEARPRNVALPARIKF